MKPNIVIDVGNSRIKWGFCAKDRVVFRASLSPDDPASWEEQSKRWDLGEKSQWAMASVHAERGERISEWIRNRGDRVSVIQDRESLPIKMILVEKPHRVRSEERRVGKECRTRSA